MTIFDPSLIARAYGFLAARPRAVLAGAALYAAPFTVQSWATAMAASGAGWAPPLVIGFGLLAFAAFVCAIAGWGAALLGGGDAGPRFGKDALRLGWVAVLILILIFTVLGTALLAVVFMLAALALINVDASVEPPQGFVDIFALYGPGETAVAVVISAVYALFSVWFFSRLALAYPATVAAGRIRVLNAWPLSGRGRAVEIVLTVLAATLPGAAALWALNAGFAAAAGFYPAAAQSAVTEQGVLMMNAAFFMMSAFVYGMFKMALVGAPLAAALVALYVKYSKDDANSASAPQTGGD
ncbi:MAG: hypothetical protein ABL308_09975 [Oceanicaulis sp.]